MARNMFGGGSNLPPGCTVGDIERAFGDDMPAACDTCRYFDEKTAQPVCPFGERYEFCPDVGLVKECQVCKKPMGIVPGCVKHTVVFMEELYCCSEACRDKLKAQVDKQIKDMEGDD